MQKNELNKFLSTEMSRPHKIPTTSRLEDRGASITPKQSYSHLVTLQGICYLCNKPEVPINGSLVSLRAT